MVAILAIHDYLRAERRLRYLIIGDEAAHIDRRIFPIRQLAVPWHSLRAADLAKNVQELVARIAREAAVARAPGYGKSPTGLGLEMMAAITAGVLKLLAYQVLGLSRLARYRVHSLETRKAEDMVE